MKRRFYSRFLSIFVGISTLAITISALLSLAQQQPPSDITIPPEIRADLDAAVPPQKVQSPACPNCYTNDCQGCYDIFEEVPGTGMTISRTIPNPAPLKPGEVRPDFDPETGLPIWYIGHQPYVGPTDEEPFSPEFPVPQVELRRIQARHYKEVFSIPGVTAFGIGAKGFTVLIELEHFVENAGRVPAEIEGIPVQVDIGGPFVNASHAATQYRPVPTSASVGRVLPGNEPKEGTTGPHIVRDQNTGAQCNPSTPPENCFIIYTLTSGHVLKHPEDPVPTPGAEPQTRQPGPMTVGLGAPTWGWFLRGFQQVRCDTPADPTCQSPSAPINDSTLRPDVAVIAHLLSPHFDALPHTSPAGSVEPIRRMYYGPSSSVNGPSGIIQVGAAGTDLKWWGVNSNAPKGDLEMKDVIATIIDFDLPGFHGNRAFKYTAVSTGIFERNLQGGDSGGLVAGNGVTNRHVFGIAVGFDLANQRRGIYFAAGDVKLALQRAGFPFSHFWGTASGQPSFWKPATTQCDGSC